MPLPIGNCSSPSDLNQPEINNFLSEISKEDARLEFRILAYVDFTTDLRDHSVSTTMQSRKRHYREDIQRSTTVCESPWARASCFAHGLE